MGRYDGWVHNSCGEGPTGYVPPWQEEGSNHGQCSVNPLRQAEGEQSGRPGSGEDGHTGPRQASATCPGMYEWVLLARVIGNPS